MGFIKIAGEEISELDALNRALDLVHGQDPGMAKKILEKLFASGCQLRNFNFLRGLFLHSSRLSFGASRCLQRELELYPDNGAALSLLHQIERDRRDLLNRVNALPKSIRISLVIVADSDLEQTRTAIENALYQAYPTIDVVVVQRERNEMVRNEILGIDPRVRVVESDGMSFWQSLELGLQQSLGDFQMVIPRSSVTFTDFGLSAIANVLHQAEGFSFISGQRVYLDALGVVNAMRCDQFRITRMSFLNERSFVPPSTTPHFTHTLWKTGLFRAIGARLDTSLCEAVDFDLFCRLLREAPLITLPVPISADRIELDGGGPRYSVRYLQEAFSLIRREKREKPISSQDSIVCPRIRLHFDRGLSPCSDMIEVRHGTPLSSTAARLLRTKGPQISLVIPSFNQAPFLGQCIESVLSQGYPRLQLLIIDGGSTDGSQEVIRKYEKHLTYWCSEPDDGHYFAVQKGFDRTHGEVMGWLNSDDKLVPQALNYIGLSFLAFPHARWLTGRGAMISESGEERSLARVSSLSREHYLTDGFDNPFIQQEGTFWHRSLWDEAGGALDPRYVLAADMELWCRFFRYAALQTLDISLGLFRVHDTQRSQVHRAEYFREAEHIHREQWELIRQGLFTDMPPAPPVLTASSIIQAAEQVPEHTPSLFER